MYKLNIAEEFFLNLGITEAKLQEKEPVSKLSGEGSSFYAIGCEIDVDPLESEKAFNPDNLCYTTSDGTKLHKNWGQSTHVSAKSEELKKMLELT